MVDKRMRKAAGLLADCLAPEVSGSAAPDTMLVCWGSTYGPALEAAQNLREKGVDTAVMHFRQVFPLNPEHFLTKLESARRVVMVEGNYSGQLALHIRQETGFAFKEAITRYDGLPVTAAYILERL
jgi:2-oxoglutarate ferredoxin oxidoreductase subunit alpha